MIYDITTSYWTQPDIFGPLPKGRARHAAAVYDDKLFIVGGLAGTDTYTLDEICYLDLKTWRWSRSWSFVARFDHSTWIWGGRIWVFGGLGPDMERTGELLSLDLKSSPAFKSVSAQGSESTTERAGPSPRSHFGQYNQQQHVGAGSSGYTANSSSVQVRNSSLVPKPVAPGAISSTRFISGPSVPSPALGTHFYVYSSGALLDFLTPAGSIRPSECSLSALELSDQQWQKLADGPEIFDPLYRWHYCAVNEDGTKAWLLGCTLEPSENGAANFEEYLSDVIALDLCEFGLLGNDLTWEPGTEKSRLPASDSHIVSKPSRLGADLSTMFDRLPETGSGSDFIITANKDEAIDDEDMSAASPVAASTHAVSFLDVSARTSVPIHVHKLILQARWPHFNRVYNSQMSEFHTRKLHIDEPYSVVRAFLYYLYTDSIDRHSEYCASLGQVAGLLVMSDVYDMPELRLQCVRRLSREMDVEHAAIVWERARTANEEWLQKRAANYCLTHWGRVVRTEGFRSLSRRSMIELHEVIDVDGRVIGGEELEVVGGFGGGKVGVGGSGSETARRRARAQESRVVDEMEDNETQDDEGMELN